MAEDTRSGPPADEPGAAPALAEGGIESAAGSAEEAARTRQALEEAESPLRSVVGLFLVPLLVVLACVGVFIGFGWIAYEKQTVADYVNDLRSGWRPRRAQAAYELSRILLADPTALDDQPEARGELRRLFAEAEDPDIRRYLALVLGYTRDPQGVETLTEALSGADPHTRIYLLWALGAIGDASAAPALTEAARDADAGIRKTAAFALGELGRAESIEVLEPLLADGVPDVRWNAALALARLGSPAGAPVLEQMLDRRLTSQVPGITPEQQQETMVSAVRALAAVRGEAALPILDRLADEDPSLKVRQAAIEARQALRSGA